MLKRSFVQLGRIRSTNPTVLNKGRYQSFQKAHTSHRGIVLRPRPLLNRPSKQQGIVEDAIDGLWLSVKFGVLGTFAFLFTLGLCDVFSTYSDHVCLEAPYMPCEQLDSDY